MSEFTWRIKNVSESDAEEVYSVPFVVNGYTWRLSIFPSVNDTGVSGNVSICLCVADSSSLPSGWSIPTKFSIALINQIDPDETIQNETEHIFNAESSECGFSFIPSYDFYFSDGGYLVNDACWIEAEVHVNDASVIFTDKALDSSVSIDPVEIECVKAQSILESLPKTLSSLVPIDTSERDLFKGQATFAKQMFDKLISYPLEDMADPKLETVMMASLYVLAENLSLFNERQANEIMNLKGTFPKTMQEVRNSIQVKGSSSLLLRTTYEKTKILVEELLKIEDELKNKIEDLNMKQKELDVQLEIIKTKRQQHEDERVEVSKQMKEVCILAKEQASRIEVEDAEVDGANKKLESLKSKWDAMRHLFDSKTGE